MGTSASCDRTGGDAFAELCRFRGEFFDWLIGRGDELFELTDALLCSEGPVRRWSGWRWRPSIGAGAAPCTAL
ncbi:hypothetical protein AVL59_24530 [Streptomyces griseochromogenes]|uniref:Uncharacterized protein n=1 Tax=Streptomyces griseochromogenes TaxID=68214 RepID=A0A1B1B0E0_9ACTN|nr:hypothetical protein AVL59_24515 [Streptomyces griseochromogenes]ANP52290.1 hypothetical protein AVL59_24530 [Streptomyces griseochromogenes]